MSNVDTLIREHMAAAAAFEVATDPGQVRESVAGRQRQIRRRRRAIGLFGLLATAGVTIGVVGVVDRDSGGDVVVRPTDTSAETSDDTAASTSAAPYFRPAPGWHISETGATAANIPLGAASRSGAVPWDTVERLQDGDVVLFAMFWRKGKADLPPREFPLSLDDAQPGGLEGQPDIYAETLLAQVESVNIDLRIFYGGTVPAGVPPIDIGASAEERAAAREQLARLVVPAAVEPG